MRRHPKGPHHVNRGHNQVRHTTVHHGNRGRTPIRHRTRRRLQPPNRPLNRQVSHRRHRQNSPRRRHHHIRNRRHRHPRHRLRTRPTVNPTRHRLTQKRQPQPNTHRTNIRLTINSIIPNTTHPTRRSHTRHTSHRSPRISPTQPIRSRHRARPPPTKRRRGPYTSKPINPQRPRPKPPKHKHPPIRPITTKHIRSHLHQNETLREINLVKQVELFVGRPLNTKRPIPLSTKRTRCLSNIVQLTTKSRLTIFGNHSNR